MKKYMFSMDDVNKKCFLLEVLHEMCIYVYMYVITG